MEAEIVRELGAWWAKLNAELFGGRLRPCAIAVEKMKALGMWRAELRRIELSWELILEKPWLSVLEVLKHEMAHQFVTEVLGVREETAHGATFRAVCRERGIDARAAGDPEVLAEEGVATRIRKLLALSESPNVHEAEAAMSAAMRLLRKHGLDQRDLEDTTVSFRAAQLGQLRARVPKHEQLLAGLLTEHFGVRGLWIAGWDPVRDVRGRVLEVVGEEHAVELAAYVHAVVLATAEREWADYRRRTGLRSDRERRRFIEGLVLGLRTKLKGAEQELRAEGLVPVSDARLEEWMAARHPRVVRRTLKVQLGGAHAAGRVAGQELEIRSALKERSGGRPALIGARE